MIIFSVRWDRVALTAATGRAVPCHDELDGGKRQLWGPVAKQQFPPGDGYCSSGKLSEGRRACGQEVTLHECHQRASQRRLREKIEWLVWPDEPGWGLLIGVTVWG